MSDTAIKLHKQAFKDMGCYDGFYPSKQNLLEFLWEKKLYTYIKIALKIGYSPIKVKFWSFEVFGVVIHPEVHIEILRHMSKELAQFNLPFFSYGQNNLFYHFEKIAKNYSFWA